MEIQIRTHEMHANSERGVAAHWRYKEGGRSDQAYERKINQLRSLLAPPKAATRRAIFSTACAWICFRIGSTWFRPRVRSSMCRWAARRWISPIKCTPTWAIAPAAPRSTGAWWPLDYQLKNSETVEIITAKTGQPSRDWLSPQSGFLASPRHRNKVRAWFRKQNATQNKAEGRAMFDREIHRLGINNPPVPELLSELKLPSTDALHEALGLGEVSPAQMAGAIQRIVHAREARPEQAARAKKPGGRSRTGARGSGHRRSAVHVRALLQTGAARGHRRLYHRRPGRQHPCAILRQSRPPQRQVPGAGAGRDLGQAGVARISGGHRSTSLRSPRTGARRQRRAWPTTKSASSGMNTVTDKRDNVAHMLIKISITGLPQLSQVLARIAQAGQCHQRQTKEIARDLGPASVRGRIPEARRWPAKFPSAPE